MNNSESVFLHAPIYNAFNMDSSRNFIFNCRCVIINVGSINYV